MRSEVTDVTSVVKYISKSVLDTKTCGALSPQSFVRGGSYGTPHLALMLLFSSIVSLCGVTDTCLGPEAKCNN